MNASNIPEHQTGHPWTRIVRYVAALVVIPVVAFLLGVRHFEAVNCSGPNFDGECDVAGVEGILWAVAAFVLVSLAILIVEVRRFIQRRRTA